MAFKALLQQKDIDMERGAVLSELKDRDSILQRVAMEYYRFLHSDTVLPTRFPIGLEKLVKNFGADDFAAFYKRHYYPSNMCLYVAGDVDAADMEAKIQRVFGDQPAGPRDGAKGNDPAIQEHKAPVVNWPRRGKIIEHASFREGDHVSEPAPLVEGEGTSGATALAAGSDAADNDKSYHAISHQLLTEFSMSMCTKTVESKTFEVGHLRQSLVDSLIGMVLDFRMNEIRLRSKDPIFNSIGWSFSSTPREGCSMNSFSISSQPKRWKEAMALGMGEASRMATHGVTEGEMTQSITTLNNYFATQAVMNTRWRARRGCDVSWTL